MFEIIKYKNFSNYLFLDKTINFLKNGDFKSAQMQRIFKFIIWICAFNIKNKDNQTVFDFVKDEEIRKILRNVLWNKNKLK